MATRYDYKVFPETWMGRIMLALAFLAGCGVLVVFALFAGFEREYAPIEGPCPSAYPECMEAETSLTEMSTPTCGEFPPRVCLAPLGRVSPELVTHLVEYYEGEYGLSIQVITPAAISRVRKMVTKYIGLWYYDLEVSDDPDSPMFNNILGPADLDRMAEPLPVADAR
jgi:hypothetical protein